MKMKHEFLEVIKNCSNPDLGITVRKITLWRQKIYLLYIQELTDRKVVSDSIIRPLIQYQDMKNLDALKIMESVLYMDQLQMDMDSKKILEYVLKGQCVLVVEGDNHYIVANTLMVEKRSVSSPEIDTTLRGPKDSFTENINTNISLIRYRIKDPSLTIEHMSVGKRTNTAVLMFYIKDIANDSYVKKVRKRLESIHIDGVFESGYIQKFLSNNLLRWFPQAGIVEVSSTACEHIMDGKICVMVEGSNLALIVPKIFIEFFDTGDDHYQSIYLSIFSKYLRILAFLIALTFSSLYVAVVGFHPEILPPQYVLALAMARSSVPFNGFLEALIMETVAEILREASIRLPKQVGPAIGIVGAIVIGQAAVSAGLLSPLKVIIASLSMMCSFAAADYTIMNPIRVLKLFLLLLTGALGLFGFTIGMIVITIILCSEDSFGIPYLAPIAPFHWGDLKAYLFSDVVLANRRPKFLKTKDSTIK